jgi:hypothetical protein
MLLGAANGKCKFKSTEYAKTARRHPQNRFIFKRGFRGIKSPINGDIIGISADDIFFAMFV